jgi:hypothetical protein
MTMSFSGLLANDRSDRRSRVHANNRLQRTALRAAAEPERWADKPRPTDL